MGKFNAKSLVGKFSAFFNDKKSSVKNSTENFAKEKRLVAQPLNPESAKPYDYFTLARSWADDFYVAVEASRNRWKALSLWVLVPLSALLLICVTFLIPAQHLVPLMINHYQNGQTVVTTVHQAYAPKDQAQVESDIARYVRFRESYSADTYNYSYRLIRLMSSHSVSDSFARSQSVSNKHSPINLLGDKGYQTVKIESILFLDNENKNKPHHKDQTHRNLAQVDFVVTTHNKHSGKETTVPLTALISWKYKGMPDNPSERWMDWNGFVVNSYHVQTRNV